MVLKVQPHLERGYFFFADSYLILMNRFYVKYYSSIKIRCSMHNGINTNYYLAIICSCPLFVTAKVILFSE